MGAQLWYHEAPWHPDPAVALQALQARFLTENYDLPSLLPQHLIWAREAVAAAAAEGDPYGLVELYEERVRLLERLNKLAVPQDAQAQIEILRQIYADGGQGISNVLDVERISEKRDTFTAQRLSVAEALRLVGTERPTIDDARNSVSKINEELCRGECVCFPVYDKAGKQPVAWYFVGNTVD
ncbi:MAG TPA: hypothetical protein VGY66_22075 [Gemmataceae bacterium]|jgi:hypothetical protein|nr:hypothetical protein [Gemmataceae bacterium]